MHNAGQIVSYNVPLFHGCVNVLQECKHWKKVVRNNFWINNKLIYTKVFFLCIYWVTLCTVCSSWLRDPSMAMKGYYEHTTQCVKLYGKNGIQNQFSSKHFKYSNISVQTPTSASKPSEKYVQPWQEINSQSVALPIIHTGGQCEQIFTANSKSSITQQQWSKRVSQLPHNL